MTGIRLFSSVLAALLAAAAVAPPLRAQVPTFGTRSNLVVLSATAVDKAGRPVRDLRRDELKVFDEGRPQPIQHFKPSRELPARVLLLVDASGSMNGELKSASARMAAVQIMAALGAEDQVALAGFDHKYWGIVAFTQDRASIEKGFEELTPFGSTALHDALDKAARDLASHGEGRRAVVVITDGIDTASQLQAEAVIARSRALDVPIYTLSVLSTLDDPKSRYFVGRQRTSAGAEGAGVLSRYAQMSGGASFVVSDFRGLKLAADQIAGELKHQYRLGYDPPSTPAHFRRIEVRTTRKGVIVKTRRGYLPPT